MTRDPVRSTTDLTWGPISYLEWQPTGDVTGTVVLLHGGGLDSASLSWAEVGPALAGAGWRVVAPDHPGYGESPLPPWRGTQERLLDYVDEFTAAVAPKRYVVGGLSMGGGLTLGHTLRHPDRVGGIMLLGSGGLMQRQRAGWTGVPIHLVTWLSVRSGLMEALFRWTSRSRRITEWSLQSIVRDPAQRTEALLEEVLAGADSSSAAAFGQWQHDQILPTRIRHDYTDQLGAVTCPTLVVHADGDVGVPMHFAENAARRIPDARLLVVEEAGHWVQRDRPDIVVPAMINFLESVGGPRGAAPADS